jgi:hypothetical protein
MGNSNSSNSALENFYSQAIGKHMTFPPSVERNTTVLMSSITGGEPYPGSITAGAYPGSVSGGYSSLEDYGNSVYSEAKEKLIRGIAKDVASVMHVNASFTDTASIKDVVSKLKAIVPNPREKRGIKTDSAMHKVICEKLATSINSRYGINVIDVSSDPANICHKVSELMYSLFTGLHSEFLTIATDVTRILKNLQLLQEYVDAANKKLIGDLSKSSDGSVDTEAIQSLYTRLTEEIDRQHAILANLTNSTIGPVGKSLITMLEDNEDFKSLTDDLKKMTGTIEFSDKLGYLLNGSADVTHAADVVDKALKKIGLSVAEYKSSKNIKDLQEKVYRSMMKAKPSSEELYKLLAAADILYKNDMAHEDIVAYLEKKKGGYKSRKSGGGEFDSSFADDADAATYTDATPTVFKGRPQSSRTSISKQIRDKAQLRKQLFSVFNNQVKSHYDKIKYSISCIGKKIGGEIPLTQKLDVFIRQLNNFSESQPDKQNMHIALSGYRKDTNSTFVKYQFMENLYAISEAAGALTTEKNGQMFKEIKNSVDALITLVNEFNTTFTNTLSDIHINELGVKGKHGAGQQISDISSFEQTGGDCGCDGGNIPGENDDYNGGNIPGENDDYNGGDIVFDNPLDSENTEETEDLPFSELTLGGKSKSSKTTKHGGIPVNPVNYESMVYTTLGGVVSNITDAEFNHYKTIKRSIREIDYFYRIANIKTNIQKSAGEFENNTENYENILGEEAGFIIDQIQLKYNNLLKAADPEEQDQVKDFGKLYANSYTLASENNLNKALYENLAALKTENAAGVSGYLDGYKFLLEYIRSAKIDMLEAAQALDMYLSKFTESMQFKPDQIKDFVQILEQIEIVAKWFTDKSGDSMVGVFESFTNKLNTKFLFDESINDFSGFSKKNAADGTINNPLDGDIYTITETHYYETLAKKQPGLFYQPRMMNRDQAINFVKQIEKSVKGVRAMENIIATFSRVNVNVSSEIKTFMTNGSMFKAFMKYSIASVISVGYLGLAKDTDSISAGFVSTPADAAHAKMAVGLRFNKSYLAWDDTTCLELCDPLSIPSKALTLQDADICDKIFEMSIKSIIAKIFTVIGTYTLFNKPAQVQDSNSLSLSINPLRQILGGKSGGADKEIRKIIPAATELYIRLPLLVEWYRTVFEFNETDTGAADAGLPKQYNPLISMIPDMDSIWGDLCKVIFLDARNIVDGSYPVEYANRIIDSINKIYTHYRSKKSDINCREILTEFVLEINRRYGFIMREEINMYLSERNKYIDIDEEYPADERVDYDLVDVESQMGRRPAPSDRFRTFNKTKSSRKFDLQDLLKATKRFRQSIESNLTLTFDDATKVDNTTFRNIANVSLNGVINETQKKIESSGSDAGKYQIVHQQLHGIGKFADIDQQKFLLFHETVITPMTVLYFTYLILNDFNKFCVSLNVNSGLVDFDAKSFIASNVKTYKGDKNPYKTKRIGDNTAIMDSMFNISEYAIYLDGVKSFKPIVVETVLRKLMNVGCDMNGLTEIYFMGSGSKDTYPSLNYDKLEETCTELFNNAKSAFHQLRKFMPTKIVETFENPKIDGLENRISLFYIQEQLFDRLFANKYGNGLSDANIGLKTIWLKATTKDTSCNNTFSKIGFWDITEANKQTLTFQNFNELKNKYSFPIKYIPVYNSGATTGNPKRDDKPEDLRDDIINKDTIGTDALYNLNDGDVNALHTHLGMVAKLNSIIYKYCSTFIDVGTNKIYRPLIERFVNGHNAKDIMNNQNINDNVINNDGNAGILYTEPQQGAIIFASIANALKGIMTAQSDRISGTAPLYIEDNFLNISEYQKELMRTHLPAFEKELEMLAKKSEFMRRCLEETGVQVNVTGITSVNVTNVSIPSYTQENKIPTISTNAVRKPYLIGIFDDISTTAKSLIRCIEETQKELNDIPMYFETYNESIVDYNNRNGHLPLMPISHITHLMNFSSFTDNNETKADKSTKFDLSLSTKFDLSLIPGPNMGIGSAAFKFTYGTRGILNYKQKPSLDFAPGVVALLESYNGVSGGSAAFDKAKMVGITTGIVMLSRWVLDFMYHKQALDTHDWQGMQNLVLNNQASLMTTDIVRNLSCQTAKHGKPDYDFFGKTSNIILLVENDNYKQSVYRMVACLHSNSDNKLYGLDRSKFRVYNILDLNIVPINIHAMQREIPFVNLFNYSYTFDHIAKNFIGVESKNQNLLNIKDDYPTDVDAHKVNPYPEDMLVRELIYPLGYRRVDEYIGPIFRIMSGSISTGFGRPKYISDQLWNKVLMNSIISEKNIPLKFKSTEVVSPLPGLDPNVAGITSPTIQVSDKLTYIAKTVVKTIDGNADVLSLGYQGYLRYNTKLIRWTEWSVQLQRIVRLLMRSQLEWVQDPLAQGIDAISQDITEYKQTNTFSLEDYE